MGGFMGVFVAIILAASLLLFGSCTIVPGIESWQAGNAQVATIKANAEAQIAQMQAERDLAIARTQAQRDIEIAQQEAQASIQQAAIDLAGRSVDHAWWTLQMVLIGMFGVVCVAGATLTTLWLVWYLRKEMLV